MERMRLDIDARKRLALTILGFACLYTVAIVFFYYDWLFELPISPDPLIYGFVLNGSLCAAAIGTFLLMRIRFDPRALLAIGALCYGAAFACLFAAFAGSSPVTVYGAGLGAGLGAGVLMPVWFARAGALSGNQFASALGLMSLVSALGALALEFVEPVFMAVLCIALLICSLLLAVVLGEAPMRSAESCDGLGGCGASQDGDSGLDQDAAPDCSPNGIGPARQGNASTNKPWIVLAAPLVYVVILSIIYGVLDVVAMASPTFTAADSGLASQVGGLATIAAFLLYVRYDGKRYAVLLNVALGAIATGLIFLPFLPDAYSVFLVVLTHMGWEMSLLVSYALVIEVFRNERAKLIGAAAIVFAFPRPGVMLGSLVASLIAVDNQYAFAQMTIVAFALLYLIMMGVWLLRTRERRAADRAIRKRDELIQRYARARDDIYALACEELSDEYGLTQRESELLKLLAQGRDAAYVENELFLSRNTVKSYMKSIYAKLGVHSKQELIDLVKESLPIE